MYKIIGADGKEYGPVPAEQLRQWIAQGRANGQTQTQTEGNPDWKRLLEFPEFADALAAKAAAASPPPKVLDAAGEKLAAEITSRDYDLNIGDCFSRSWRLIKANFWLLVGGTALVLLISIGIESIPFVGHLARIVLAFLLWGGLDLLFLKKLRGEPVDVGVIFAGFGALFAPLALASVIAHLLTAIGFLLCILPGIYLLVAWWMFTPLLILDKGLEFWAAMECSRKVVTKHWFLCFGLLILTTLVGLGGLLGCLVGIFITLPIATGAIVFAYEDIFGGRGATTALAPVGQPGVGSPAAPETSTPLPSQSSPVIVANPPDAPPAS